MGSADDVADKLIEGYLCAGDAPMQHVGAYELPSIAEVARVVDGVRALLFPGYIGPSVARLPRGELAILVRERVDDVKNRLRRQVYRALHHKQQIARGTADSDCGECADHARDIAEGFVARLPALRERVAADLQAAFVGDPAASGLDEIIFCYPGFHAVVSHRIAHALAREGAPVIARIMSELAHEKTGIDIHPGAVIGDAFFIDHGTGVVVGQTTRIGNRVRIYQGVTLGALSVPYGAQRPAPGSQRHPTIEDDVVIYAGATILGGDTVIGQGAVIGGNAWVTTSVPPGARIAGSHSRRTTSGE